MISCASLRREEERPPGAGYGTPKVPVAGGSSDFYMIVLNFRHRFSTVVVLILISPSFSPDPHQLHVNRLTRVTPYEPLPPQSADLTNTPLLILQQLILHGHNTRTTRTHATQ